ncbi:MAG TPA: type IV toxin-antitoxin system AbiEi family antitoxin domain-containing protein, partial [Corynebacterium sp.]|nr:type IV toxin-antitoxin system AbiEi family antitoxin domain-containing protein [Corynebacterium sp.]
MSFEDVSHLASEQAGFFTTAQADRLGVTRVKLHRETRRGVLRSPRRGVYVFASSAYDPDEQLRAAWLSLDPSRTVAERLRTPTAVVVCTSSAAGGYGIGDFQTHEHEFYTAYRKQSRAEDIRLRIRDLSAEEVDIVEGLPLTTPTRIVVDLLGEGEELGHISTLIADALKKGLPIDWSRIAQQAPALAQNYGLSPEGLIAALGESSESPSNTARTAWSMLESMPELSDRLNQQLIDSVHKLSANLVSAQNVELAARMNGILDFSPAVPDLQRSNAELLEKIRPLLPDISSMIDASGFDLGVFHAGSTRGTRQSPKT